MPVILDKRRLERIVANLLDNAKHHAGGPVAHRPRGRRPAARCASSSRTPARACPPASGTASSSASPGGTEARRRVGTGLGPGPRRRARHGHGRPGLGRGPPRRRRPLRGLAPRGQGVSGPGWRPSPPASDRGAAPGCGAGRRGERGALALGVRRGARGTPRTVDRANIPFGLADTSTTSTTTTLPADDDRDDARPATTVPQETAKRLLRPGRQPGARRP